MPVLRLMIYRYSLLFLLFQSLKRVLPLGSDSTSVQVSRPVGVPVPPLSMSAAAAELIEFPPLGIPPPSPHRSDETLFRRRVSSWRSLPVTVSVSKFIV